MFDEAARQLRWHYQWIVLNEFLPALVGQTLANQVLREGPQWFRPGDYGFIPLEFADAAYRYGHSQIRHRYQLNLQTDPVPLFPDLLGFRPVPRSARSTGRCSLTPPARHRHSDPRKSTESLVRALIELPVAVTGECEIEDYHSLAVRDLQRGQGVGLPSGEAVARHIGIVPLTAEQVGHSFHRLAWRDSAVVLHSPRSRRLYGGHRLGPVGGRIVTEVLVGLIDADATSFRRNNQEWRPQKTLSELLAG